MNVYIIIKAPHPPWYTYAISIGLGSIAAFVIFKMFIQYKVIRMGNNEIAIHYPVLRKLTRYPLARIDYWRENQVKTGKKSVYKELEVVFEDGKKISTGQKEYTEYQKMIQYLLQKAPRKRKTAS